MQKFYSTLLVVIFGLFGFNTVFAQCGPTSITVDPQPIMICEGDAGVVNFTTTGTCAGNWQYRVNIGGTVVQAWSTTASFNAAPTTSTTYTVYTRCSSCTGSVISTTFDIEVVEEPAIAGNLVVCPGTSTTLTASGAFAPYEWWDSPAGGTQLSATDTYTTPVLNADATYYSQATGSIAGTGQGSILITECGLEGYSGASSADYLEISNLYATAVNTTGWVAAVSSSYADINGVNTILWNMPNSFNPCSVVSKNDVSTDPNYWGSNIMWNPGANTTYRSWAIIIDDLGNVIDFVVWGWTAADIALFNPTINGFNITLGPEWAGNGCDATCGVAGGPQLSIQRIGNTDSNTNGDFVCQATTVDVVNPGLLCGWPVVTNTCTFPVTVVVDTPPTASNPAPINVTCLSAVPAVDPGVVTDEMDDFTSPLNVSLFSETTAGSCPEVITRVYRVMDACGSYIDVPQTITVMINTGPVMPPNGSSTVLCLANATQPASPPVTDQCGNNLIPVITENIDPVCEGDKIYTYTYTDCAGNIGVYTYTYTIDLTTPLAPPALGTSTVLCPANATDPGAPADITDGCGNTVSAVLVGSGPAPACEGDVVWTYSYTDCALNTVNWTHTYTIDMTTPLAPPALGTSTVDCPANATDPGAPADILDGCGNTVSAVLVGNTDAPNPLVCEGTSVWTYSYTDCAGNTVNWTHTYTIDMPTFAIATPNGADAIVCAANLVVPTPPVVTDVCGNAVNPVMTENADPICIGDKIWTFTYTDCAGNVVVWTHTTSVNDNVPPTGTAPADVSLAGGSPPACDPSLVTGVLDNCDPSPTVTCLPDATDGGNCPEIITRTYHIEDACGNFIEVIQLFTIGDAIFPTASDPADINVECLALVPIPDETVVIDEWDNAATPVVTFEDDTPGGGSCPDTIIRRYRVTDNCGNYIFVSQFIIIEPITNPVVIADGLSTVNCLADAQVIPTAPPVSDVCGNVLVPVMATPLDIVCEGDMAYTFTYTDCAGNASVWTYTYTVDLPIFAIATANGTSTVLCPADANVQPAGPGVITDLCGNTLTPAIVNDGPQACEGDVVWTFTYTDCALNTLDWTHTYTVDMTTALVAPAMGVSTVNCPADAIDPGAPLDITDGCGNTVSAVLVGSDPIPACEGTVVWTYSYTDCALNTVNWTHTYTVDMPTFAIATALGTSTVNCPTDANAQPAGPGVITDLCGNVLTPAIANDGPQACEGDVIWTFTYTDCASNVVAWTHTYTIDIPAFTIATPNATSVVNCVADAQVDPGGPGAAVMDECGNVLIPVITPPSPTGCTGVGAVWTYTYTDCALNTADWLYTYTVTLAPFAIATPNAASTVDCPADALVQPADAGLVNDACGNAIIPTVATPTAVGCEGDMVWTFTYTDCAGNTLDWLYTYTVDMPTFAIGTPLGASTVNCPADAMVQPVDAGAITDVCGNVIVPVATPPVAVGCEGDMVWTFTYTDCALNTVVWTHTYTVDMTTALTAPAMGASTVNCPADAIDPGAPLDITDGCGNTVSAVLV
ncbi:MAG: hypothetical protein QNK23_02615, partial [Crocinitomicaceae bacterium]|nr:hypothetical protein [Crocinitomicaceae bacterium]